MTLSDFRKNPGLKTPYLTLAKEIARTASQNYLDMGKSSKEADDFGFKRALELCPLASHLYAERNNGAKLTPKTLRVTPKKYSMRDKPDTWHQRQAAKFCVSTGLVILTENDAKHLLDRAKTGEFGRPTIPHYIYARVFSDKETGQQIGVKIGYTGQNPRQRTREFNSHTSHNVVYEDPYFECIVESEVLAIDMENDLKSNLPH